MKFVKNLLSVRAQSRTNGLIHLGFDFAQPDIDKYYKHLNMILSTNLYYDK